MTKQYMKGVTKTVKIILVFGGLPEWGFQVLILSKIIAEVGDKNFSSVQWTEIKEKKYILTVLRTWMEKERKEYWDCYMSHGHKPIHQMEVPVV